MLELLHVEISNNLHSSEILAKMKFLSLKSGFVSKQYRESQGRCVKRIKPFLLLFKLCGMFANEITKGRLKCCSWPFYSICVFWLSLYVSYMCFLLYHFTRAEFIKMNLTVDFIKHLMGYISLGVNTIAAYITQNGLIKFFDRLESYDNEVARMKNARKDNLWIPWLVTFATVAINLSLIFVIATEPSIDTMYLFTLSDICTTIMHILGTLTKFFLLYLLLERFKHLNRKIAPNVSWDEKRYGPNAIKILDVKILHSMLYDAQQAFCSIYNNPLLIWFASLMIHIVGNIHAFREKSLIVACVFVCPPILQLLTLCIICHYTAEEANKIACILNEVMCTLVSSGQTMVKIDTFTYFLQYRVSFEAAGFFTIDLPLFQSVVASITTYFIILI